MNALEKMKTMLDFQREKLDQLAMQVPGYTGSMAQVFNENSYRAQKMAYEARAAQEEKPDPPDPAPIININGRSSGK